MVDWHCHPSNSAEDGLQRCFNFRTGGFIKMISTVGSCTQLTLYWHCCNKSRPFTCRGWIKERETDEVSGLVRFQIRFLSLWIGGDKHSLSSLQQIPHGPIFSLSLSLSVKISASKNGICSFHLLIHSSSELCASLQPYSVVLFV